MENFTGACSTDGSRAVSGATKTDKMIKIAVRFFGSIREAACKASDEMEVPCNFTAHDLIRFLSSIYGDAFKSETFKQGSDELRDDIIVSIDGSISGHVKTKTLLLRDGVAVDLFPAFPGGG